MNLRPRRPDRRALPGCATPRFTKSTPAEDRTRDFQLKRMALCQLSYEGIRTFQLFYLLHASEGTRTLNLALKRRLLFRLSYEGVKSRFPVMIRRLFLYERNVLPAELKRQKWSREDLNFHAFAPGFEAGVYTISTTRPKGGPDRHRTCGLPGANRVLSQLSYGPIETVGME